MFFFKLNRKYLASLYSAFILSCLGILTGSAPLSATYAIGTTLVSFGYVIAAIVAYQALIWLWNKSALYKKSEPAFVGEENFVADDPESEENFAPAPEKNPIEHPVILPTSTPLSRQSAPAIPLFRCNIPGFENRGSVAVDIPPLSRRSARNFRF